MSSRATCLIICLSIGYACEDIVGTIFRVAKAFDFGPRSEGMKLEFLKVRHTACVTRSAHMRRGTDAAPCQPPCSWHVM